MMTIPPLGRSGSARMRVAAAILMAVLGAATLSSLAQAAASRSGLRVLKHFSYENGSDIAFDRHFIYAAEAGAEGGVHIIDTSVSPPREIGFVPCPGDQNDVDVIKPGLLAIGAFAGSGCTGSGGIRIVDAADPAKPRYLGLTEIEGGTHTLTSFPGQDLLYSSPLGSGAGGDGAQRIFDVSNPRKIRLIRTLPFGCHDISFTRRPRALAFCSGGNVVRVLDVSDARRPRQISEVANPLIEYHHSAVASPDQNVLVVGDESLFTAHECSDAAVPRGALWLYDISDPSEPEEIGYISPPRGPFVASPFGVPACTAHNFNFVRGSRQLVTSWSAGGTSVFDLTDATDPRETAFFARDSWSSYSHKGFIAANGAQGLTLLEMTGKASNRP